MSASSEDPNTSEKTSSQVNPIVVEGIQVIGTVAAIGALLFLLTGTWPPMVAIESGSMEPVVERNDIVVVTDTDRYVGVGSEGTTGVVTAYSGEKTGYESLGGAGDVIVYESVQSQGKIQIIHRAMFWVDEGENWVDSEKVNQSYIRGASCSQVANCPAPHSGFITKGDANPVYDQAGGISSPVKPEWVRAKAGVRIPYLGWLRLSVSGR